MSNIKAFPGWETEPTEPNAALIEGLREVLALAESGQLQSFIGTGFINGGLRVTTWSDYHNDVYQMLGSLAWLQAEYIHRHTKD